MPTQNVPQNKKKRRELISMDKNKKKKEYSCPMHPEIVEDKPGSCPRCGMNLVLKEQYDTDLEAYEN